MDSVLAYCHELATVHHDQYCKLTGGTNTIERWAHKNVVENSDAEAEAFVEDSNIDEFRGPPVQGVAVVTRSYSQWEASRHSALEKERARADYEVELEMERRAKRKAIAGQQERLRYKRALEKYAHCNGPVENSRLAKRVTHNETVAALNAMSLLSGANPHQSADEQVYKQWLESRDIYNPIIESNRISYIGGWLGHMSLNGKAHEVVGNMKRLNEERTSLRRAGTERDADRASYTAWWETVDLVPAANDSVYTAPVQRKPFKTQIVSSFSASVEESVRHHRVMEAINNSPMGVFIDGVWVQVSHDQVRDAFMDQAKNKGGVLPIL
jgi:hypothetical protein